MNLPSLFPAATRQTPNMSMHHSRDGRAKYTRMTMRPPTTSPCIKYNLRHLGIRRAKVPFSDVTYRVTQPYTASGWRCFLRIRS